MMPPSITICSSNPYKQNLHNSDNSDSGSGFFESFDKEDQEFEHWPESDILTHWKGKSLEVLF